MDIIVSINVKVMLSKIIHMQFVVMLLGIRVYSAICH